MKYFPLYYHGLQLQYTRKKGNLRILKFQDLNCLRCRCMEFITYRRNHVNKNKYLQEVMEEMETFFETLSG
jgi:hypothetical protein